MKLFVKRKTGLYISLMSIFILAVCVSCGENAGQAQEPDKPTGAPVITPDDATPQAEDPAGYYEFVIENNEATITKYIAGKKTVVIPSKINGAKVTRIGYCAFENSENIISIIIPDSVNSIEEMAFRNCKSLKNVTIPNGVTCIEDDTFSGCTSLENITIPDSVTSIKAYAFYDCESLESITIPDGVSTIARYSFYNCKSLKSVTIPSSVSTIAPYAFSDCKSLASVTIPDTVVSIGYGAFHDTLWYNNFEGDFVIANNFLIGYKGRDGAVEIPNGVTSIGDNAFRYCTGLTSVTIPDSVTSIGHGAFENCVSLAMVNMPSSIAIADGAFSGTPWASTADYAAKTNNLYYDYNVERIGTEVDLYQYYPFVEWNKVVKADFVSTLAINNNYPRLDGATAFYPMYSAVTETVYKGLDSDNVYNYVACSTTTGAYDRIINGDVDVIFCLEPSQAQLDAAKEKGVKLVLTKISSEAFVFFVNKDNKVGNLTVEQIQDIYTKQMTNWKELGGDDSEIMPFQRSEGSGSQTIMQRVMQGTALFTPMMEEVAQEMGSVIRDVATYRNYSNAIGYSFRFYATVMNPNASIKLLPVNGVAPTFENIENGTYPFIYDIYAITTEETAKKENVKALISWLTSEQGQRIVELSGYCPIK